MAKPLLRDELWKLIKPLLPPPKRRRRVQAAPRPQGPDGHPTGIPWEYLPREIRCGSEMTCWRRLRNWKKAGFWEKLHRVLLEKLQAAGKIEGKWAVIDSASVRAMHRGKNGPSPVDRRKYGTKHHLLVDAKGRVPLAYSVTAANRHDVNELLPLVDAVPAVKGRPGHPRRRPETLLGDRAYDSDPHREQLRQRSIRPRIARRNTDKGSGLGVYRWVVERAESWVHKHRRLKLRYERRDDIHEAFVALACALICHNCLLDPFY